MATTSTASRDTTRRKKQQQKDQIHFVNARPSSETEKLKIQRMVRAHVGKWISDQTRDRSVPGIPGVEGAEGHLQVQMQMDMQQMENASDIESGAVLEDCEVLSRSGSSTDAGSSHSSSPERNVASEQVVALRSSSRGPGDWQNDTHSKDNDNRCNINQVVGRSETIDRTGSGYWDPFHTYPSHYAPEFVNLHERYSLSIVWPFLTPDSPSGSGIVANSTWFPLSLTDSTLFTAFLFGSLSHQYVRWRNRSIPHGAFKPQDLRTLQMVEIETIKLVNNAVQDPTRAASDAVLLSVLCMAHNTAYSTQQRRSNTPFTAPLQRLQWLDVYASLPPNLVHVKGLIQMVLLRGGMKNIELPGLPSILSFSDIVTASAYLTRPVFSWMPLEKNRRGLKLQALLGFGPLGIEHGFGRFGDIGFTPEMTEAFQAARAYTKIAEGYIQGSLTNPDLTLIVDQRNLVHYTILSLPSANELLSLSHQSHQIIYEACRLAALVYGVGVVFPLPSGSTPLPALARHIQKVLQLPSPTIPSIWTSSDASIALLWVLALGGIAAENLPERTWFITALGHTARENRISCYSDFRDAVGSMLWFDAACEQPGRRLWGKVERFVFGLVPARG